jgi:Flp pilus assembly protein CpaB
MRSRGLVVAIAVVLAALAAAAVILYTNGIREEARSGGELTTAIVATQDIPANTVLNPLLEQGAFKELEVPTEAVVEGSVLSFDELRGTTTTSPILANEQISSSRLSTGEAPVGGALGISPGHVGVTVQLGGQQGGAGTVQVGDNVTVYATFQDIELIGGNLRQLLRPGAAEAVAASRSIGDFTLTLVPTVRVLRIQNPPVDESGRAQNEEILLTLDLEKKDAQNLVFAKENGLVWVGLLPPGEDGEQLAGSTVPIELILGRKGA